MTDGDDAYLAHIREAIERIEDYTAGVTYEEFQADPQLQDAVVRRLQVIGEASKKLSEEARTDYSSIPWSDVAGMRDILTHRYFGVDLEAVWDTVREDLPGMKEALS